MGFLMSIASLLSIKVTSPITHMISSAVRGVAGSLLAMKLFNDIITTLVQCGFPLSLSFLMLPSRSGRASSIGTILFGSILYTWVKHQESQPAKRDTPERMNDDIELGEKGHK